MWANYTSAMKRDLDPCSPFLEPDATSSAQKCVKKLSSMVQQSHTSPHILQLPSPDASLSGSDDEPRDTKQMLEDGLHTPRVRALYVHKGVTSPKCSTNERLRFSADSCTKLNKVQQDSGNEVLVGSLPKRSLLPNVRVIDLSKPNVGAANPSASR